MSLLLYFDLQARYSPSFGFWRGFFSGGWPAGFDEPGEIQREHAGEAEEYKTALQGI